MGQSISLVLSSGGARGYAHIGVIEVLEQAGFEIRAVVGSSIGALIGGLYANQTLEEYKKWVLTLDFMDVLRLVDFNFSKAGMIKGDRIFEKMEYLLGDTRIESLSISYTAVATDLLNQREVWFQRGSLKNAIRASIATPMIFTPVMEDGRLLVDGGVLNPLPVAPTVSHHNDLVVAVDLNAPHSANYPVAPPPQEQQRQDAFRSSLARFLDSVGWPVGRKEQSSKINMGMFDLMSRTFESMQLSLSSYKTAGYPPDVMIQIPADACSFYDFHRAYEMIEVGRVAAEETLQTLARGSPY